MTTIDLSGLMAMLHAPESETEITIALREFVSKVQDYCREERDIPQRIRTLRFARAELSSVKTALSAGAGKKCAHSFHRRKHRLDD